MIQSLLISRASYPRHVMPVDNATTDYFRSQIVMAVMGILGIRGYTKGDSALATLLFTPEKFGLGMGLTDPMVAGSTMDARRLIEGFEASDDRQAAALWAAIPEALDGNGKVKVGRGSYNTAIRRLAALWRLGI